MSRTRPSSVLAPEPRGPYQGSGGAGQGIGTQWQSLAAWWQANWALCAKIAGISLLAFLSYAVWYHAFMRGLTLVYNDAMSHLDMARLVVDNRQPGLAQLGGVWLPLSHVLALPLIWSDVAWHSGLAGSLVSMVAFVCSGVGIYRIVYDLVPSRLAAIAAVLAFALNVNMLYLQATPLTEPLYVVWLVFSVRYFVRYIKTGDQKYLLPLGLFSAAQVLTRYDGWFVVVATAGLLGLYELWVRRASLRQAFGRMYLFGLPPLFAALLWLAWNALIFGSPLYFALGPYSAHAQQEVIGNSAGGLITEHNLGMSLKAYGLDIVANIGLVISLAGLAGWLAYLIFNRSLGVRARWLALGMAMSVVVFNVIALFLGFSILNLPELNWQPSADQASSLFNVRYGILALPAVAIGVGLLVALRPRWLAPLAVAAVAGQGVWLYQHGIITIDDGVKGSSAFVNQDAADWLRKHVDGNDTVLMSLSSFNSVAFKSGLDLKQFIHEGVDAYWADAIANPDRYADWVVMPKGDVGDPVYTSLVTKEKGAFERYFQKSFTGTYAVVYRHRAPNETYIGVNGTRLAVGRQTFTARGVNSYDLAYQEPEVIDTTLRRLRDAGVNTVRFWVFGDGHQEGFQPDAGVINEERLARVDTIIAAARKYQLRLVPTLVNNWTDYGGANQYLVWLGKNPGNYHDDFYTDPNARELYKNYVRHIINRKNTITGTAYAEEPAILAWDLMNEPETTVGNEHLAVAWTDEMARFVKSMDSNHLVTIGLHQRMADAALGRICGVRALDLCQVHMYLEDKNLPIYASFSRQQQVLDSYRRAAGARDKPLLLGEIGISKNSRPYGQPPLTVLRNTINHTRQHGYAGWLVWNWAEKPDDSFGFSPDGVDGAYTIGQLSVLMRGR